MKETGLTGKRRSTTIAATPDDGKMPEEKKNIIDSLSGVTNIFGTCFYDVKRQSYAVFICTHFVRASHIWATTCCITNQVPVNHFKQEQNIIIMITVMGLEWKWE